MTLFDNTPFAADEMPSATNVTPYQFEGHNFSVVEIEGEPWFIVGEVARELGYEHVPHLTRLMDADEKGVHIVDTLGGPQQVSLISEPGLYRAIIQRRANKKHDASLTARLARFQRWVFHDILPSIRKTGSYGAPPLAVDLEDPATLQGLLLTQCSKRIEAEARATKAELQIEEAKPKTAFFDRFLNADGMFGLQISGKILQQGPNKFIRYLKQEHLFYRNGSLVPRERYNALGIFDVKPYVDDTGTARYQTFLTPKGIQYFAQKLGVSLAQEAA